MEQESKTVENHQKTHAALTEGGSALDRYMMIILGEKSLAKLIYFEFCQFLSVIPGMVGLGLRKIFWPRLFGSCGKGTVFGARIKLTHPGRIHLGKQVIISDDCILDGRSNETNPSIELGDGVILSYGVLLSSKGTSIKIGDRVGIGAYTVVQGVTGNPVEIGEDAIIAPHCYIIGGGDYNTDRTDMPIAKQGHKMMGGTKVGDGVWLGAGAIVLGGLNVGRDSIIGAGSVVVKPLDDYSVNVGIPAKTVKSRKP